MSSFTFSQTNFSGIWVLKTKQQLTGPEYLNALPTKIIVTQQKDSIVIESTTIGPDGTEATIKQVIAIDGKPYYSTTQSSRRKYVRTFQWVKSNNSFLIKTVYYLPDNDNEIDFTRLDTWLLKEGELMIDRRSVETNSETWETVGIFKRNELTR